MSGRMSKDASKQSHELSRGLLLESCTSRCPKNVIQLYSTGPDVCSSASGMFGHANNPKTVA